MSFKISEFEFARLFIENWINLKNDSSFIKIQELNIRYGKPDLLVMEGDTYKKILHEYSSLRDKDVSKVVSLLLYSDLSFDSILDKLPVKRGKLQLCLDRLLSLRLVDYKDAKFHLKLDDVDQIGAGITAYEFKLNDWKQALTQAIKYKITIPEVTIVMPKNKERVLLNNISYFKKNKVSIAVYSESDNLLKSLYRTTKTKSKKAYYQSILNIAPYIN
jgi:hypothetical protein